MPTDAQQVFDTRSAWNRIVLLAFALLLAGLFGCQETPPRADKWRAQPLDIYASANGVPSNKAGADSTRVSASQNRNTTLRIHMNADPGSLNPMASPSVWTLRIMMDTVFETLLRYQPAQGKSPGVYEAGLAQSWSVSPDGREIRIQIQPSARFHDGKSVTALDVQFSIEAAMTKRGGAEHHRLALADLAAVEIVGRDQVRLKLHRNNAFVLRELAAIPILPEHVYLRSIQQHAGQWIGSGPYQVSKDESEGVMLARDDNYWGKAPAIDLIQFVRHKDSAIALREAKEGQMDIIPELIAEHYPEQVNSPVVATNFNALKLEPASFSYMVLNTTTTPFDDLHVRRAMRYLADGDAMVAASGGLTRRVAGPVWPGGPGDGAPPAPETQDQAELSRLLELAGWRDDDGDGVRARAGQRLMIAVLATDDAHAQRDPILKALRQAGFVLDMRIGSPAVLLNRLRESDFHLAFLSWSGHFDRDLSPLFSSGGKDNYGQFQSVSIDHLLMEIKAAWEPALRAPLLTTLADALHRSMPIVALLAPAPQGLVHKRVRGLVSWDNWFSIRSLSFSNSD